MLAVVTWSFCLAATAQDRGPLTSGGLTPNQELDILEVVVRYAIKEGQSPCRNLVSSAAYCLSVRSQDPTSDLLKRLADVRPQVLSASECQRRGIIEGIASTIDPGINVWWLKTTGDESVKTRVTIYCDTSEPTLTWRGSRWVLAGGMWVGCGPVPVGCEP